MKMEQKMENLLKTDGISCMGFGIVGKAVMMDSVLTPEAKAIYAYLASFAGAGESCFPTRAKILSDLSIGKERYYSHFKLLIQEGYLRIEKMKGYLNRNCYYLVSNPKKLQAKKSAGQGKTSNLIASGIHSKGYGMIYKAVMKDTRLSITAKAIYAYLSSYAGAGTVSFPTRSRILHDLGISESTYYKHFHQLLDCGYLTVKQRKAGHKFSVNDYYFNEFPNASRSQLRQKDQQGMEKNSPCLKKQDNGYSQKLSHPKNRDKGKTHAFSYPKKPDNRKPSLIFPNTVSPYHKNQDNIKATVPKSNRYYYHYHQKNDEAVEQVKHQIGYGNLKCDPLVSPYLEAITNIIASNNGSKEPDNPFLQLTEEHIRYVCHCLSNSTATIQNPYAYLTAALRNAPHTFPYSRWFSETLEPYSPSYDLEAYERSCIFDS